MTTSTHGPNRRRWYAVSAAAAWIAAGIGYLTLEAIAASGFRGHYSYAHNAISDLGVSAARMSHGHEIASPLAYLMNTAFVVQGTLFLVGAVLVCRAYESRNAGMFLTLAATNTVGNILVATVHSGPTAQAVGSIWVHVVGALLAIVGGNAAILAGSSVLRNAGWPPWYRRVSVAFAAFGLLSLTMLAVTSAIPPLEFLPLATWERCSVYPIIAWQMFTAACLLARVR
jgi:hypothetical membrane protein